MNRVRISTTVDKEQLKVARSLLRQPDSRIIDRALKALINELEGESEIRALQEHPYEGDPDLAWEVSEVPALPYDGEVPKEVLAQARARRRRR